MDMLPTDAPAKSTTLTVAEDGQIHIPAEMTEWLRAKPGEQVEVTAENGRLQVGRPRLPPGALFGVVKVSGPPLTIEEIDDIVADAAVARAMRGLRRQR